MDEIFPIDQPSTPEELQSFIERWNESVQLKRFGMEIDLADPSVPIARIPRVEEYHRGGIGSRAVNGAVIASLCDLVIGLTGLINLPDGPKGTAELNVRYLSPLKGGSVTAVGKVDRVARSLVFSSAEVRDENGTVCAIAQGIVSSIGKSDQK